MSILRVVGKFLISVGIGVLLFVAWMLWGTGISTGNQQERLATSFEQIPEITSSTPPENFRPEPGDPVFRLEIPAIDVDHIVVEGVGVEELKLGPGHYPSCREGFEPPLCFKDEGASWPGQEGQVVVSGHRTTYGAPFWDLDKLEKGDKITVTTKWGTFEYRVTSEKVVDDQAGVPLSASGRSELLLTTCNPKFSADQRYLVWAELVTS